MPIEPFNNELESPGIDVRQFDFLFFCLNETTAESTSEVARLAAEKICRDAPFPLFLTDANDDGGDLGIVAEYIG